MRSSEKFVAPQSDYYMYSPSAAAAEMFFYIICTGHFFYERGYSLKRDSYDSYLLLYVKEGTMIVSSGGEEKRAVAGDFVFLDCYLPHSYRADTGCECYWCHFDGISARAYYRSINEKQGIVFSIGREKSPQDTLIQLYRHFSSGEAVSEPLVSKYLTDILTDFLLETPEGKAPSEDRQSVIANVISYINEHLSENIMLEALASHAGLSKFHFIRTFRLETGYTPHEYIRTARLNLAKYLLTNTVLSLREITASAGFSCESVFCTAFKQKVGMTPGEYRRLTAGA